MRATLSHNVRGCPTRCGILLPFNLFMGILETIEPAKAMRANVPSNWRVFYLWGVYA